jgi:hypothetical protein
LVTVDATQVSVLYKFKGCVIKEYYSIIAISLTCIAYVPYIFSICKGRVRPHFFSWVIWFLTTFVVFAAQVADGAGVGAWPLGVASVISCSVMFLAYKHSSKRDITSLDKMFLVIALFSLWLWYLTSDPAWSVIILTIVDVCGFAPTFRKGYYKPFDDQPLLFILLSIRGVFILLALEHYSVSTALFPLMVSLMCITFATMLLYRRKRLLKENMC